MIEPVGYLQTLRLVQHCGLVVTDSGGLQKEAFFMGKAYITTRYQTELVELLQVGANELVGVYQENILDAIQRNLDCIARDEGALFGGGQEPGRVVAGLKEFLAA